MSIYIIASIIFLLVLMVSYAFISHAVEKRRIQRQRLLTSLKVRQRNFRHMVTGLPPHFLNNDLMALVYRALIETCEQLNKLEPGDPKHEEDLQLYSSQLNAMKQSDVSQRARLESPEQIKEIRQHLQELFRFVGQQESSKAINKTQAAAFTDQIKRLALQSSVDGYIFQAKQAQQAGKVRLAIHHYTLARKLLAPENASHIYDKQMAQLSAVIAKLEEASAKTRSNDQDPDSKLEDESITSTATAAGPVGKEWDNFSGDDDDWKKKQLYD